MANTTSGTVTFDKTFAVDDLIAEAYERIGSQVTSGYQLKTRMGQQRFALLGNS